MELFGGKQDAWGDFFKAAANPRNDESQKTLLKANVGIQAFYSEPMVRVKKQVQAMKKIQASAVSTDFDQLITNAFNVTIQEDNFDMGWEKAFQTVPKDPQKEFWTIYDVENGITFRKYEEGQRVRVEGISGEQAFAFVDYYAAALGWTDKMIRYRQVAAMVDKARMFRNKFFANKSDVHYLLIAAAAAGYQTGWQGVAADGQLQRDITTFNLANFTVRDRLKDAGYGDTANVPIIGYANPLDKDRIEAVMNSTTASLATAGRTGAKAGYRVTWIYTFSSFVTQGFPILAFPGNKSQRHDDMQPTTYVAPVDVLTLEHVQAVWAIYGAICGDPRQFQQFELGD